MSRKGTICPDHEARTDKFETDATERGLRLACTATLDSLPHQRGDFAGQRERRELKTKELLLLGRGKKSRGLFVLSNT